MSWSFVALTNKNRVAIRMKQSKMFGNILGADIVAPPEHQYIRYVIEVGAVVRCGLGFVTVDGLGGLLIGDYSVGVENAGRVYVKKKNPPPSPKCSLKE